jgi:hypothetical protein
MRKSIIFFAITLAVLFTSCGGGGGSNSSSNNTNTTTTVTTGAAQGVYAGTTNSGYTFEAILLPNDRFYAIYGQTSGSTFYISGMMTGQGTSKSGSYSSSYNDFYYSGLTYTGNLTATYVAGTSFNGSYIENNSTSNFTAAALSSSSFNYNSVATLSTVTGTWTGTYLDGYSASITVSGTGTFSGSDQGCSFTGTVTPDASGKNFYNVSLTFGASPCLLPNQTGTGIAITYLLSDGIHRQILVGGTVGNMGTLFLGTK